MPQLVCNHGINRKTLSRMHKWVNVANADLQLFILVFWSPHLLPRWPLSREDRCWGVAFQRPELVGLGWHSVPCEQSRGDLGRGLGAGVWPQLRQKVLFGQVGGVTGQGWVSPRNLETAETLESHADAPSCRGPSRHSRAWAPASTVQPPRQTLSHPPQLHRSLTLSLGDTPPATPRALLESKGQVHPSPTLTHLNPHSPCRPRILGQTRWERAGQTPGKTPMEVLPTLVPEGFWGGAGCLSPPHKLTHTVGVGAVLTGSLGHSASQELASASLPGGSHKSCGSLNVQRLPCPPPSQPAFTSVTFTVSCIFTYYHLIWYWL